MSAFPKGPWEATERHGFREIVGPREHSNWYGRKGVWAVAYCDTDRDEVEQDAAAHLIAAAPDLLAALIEAKGLADRACMSDSWDGSPSEDQEMLVRLRAKIDAAISRALPGGEGK